MVSKWTSELVANALNSFGIKSPKVLEEVAKRIIERYGDQSYADNLHQFVFNPLNMNDSYVVNEGNFKYVENIAEPFVYYAGKNYLLTKKWQYLSEKWSFNTGLAGGGIRSSAIDIGKWLLFNMGNGNINGVQLISESNMNFIHLSQTTISANDGNVQLSYGEGWFIDKEQYKLYTLLYHAGGRTGMHALMAYIPERNMGIVILTNQYGNKVPEVLYRRWFDLYLDKPLKDWNNIYLDIRTKNVVNQIGSDSIYKCPATKIMTINSNKYIGTYYNDIHGNLIVSDKYNDHHLSLIIGPQKITWQLNPCSQYIFKAYWPNPEKMGFPMLFPEDDLVEFIIKNNKVVQMKIAFLNAEGNGVFAKH